MLALFDRTVAKPPEGLRLPEPEYKSVALGCGGVAGLVNQLSSSIEGVIVITLGDAGAMAYSSAKQNPLLPRLFAALDDIFCIFKGQLEKLALLKQRYGIRKNANEVVIIIKAYRALRDRGPYPADQVLRDLGQKFGFILDDRTSKCTFISADADGGVSLFWGMDAQDHLMVSTDMETVKKACGKSCAHFPKGYYRKDA